MMRRIAFGLTIAVSCVASMSAAAQGYPFSQRGSITQMVAFTKLDIEYGRPTARGRALFGALVPWDSIWHPGADSATTLRISHPVQIEGQTVAAGAYSVWLIPRANRPWTLILNRATGIQHTPYPGAGTEALRVDVVPDSASRVETLTYAFPMVLRDSAVLRVQWGDLGISMRLAAPFRPGVPSVR